MNLVRQLKPALNTLLLALVVAAFVYQLVAVWYSPQGALAFYYAHLSFVLSIIAFSVAVNLYAGTPDRRSLIAISLLLVPLAAALASTLYLYVYGGDIELRQPFLTELDFAAGALLIFAVLVFSWLVWGKVLTALMVLSILYFAYGDLLPWTTRLGAPDANIIMSYLAGMGGARGVLWGIPLSADTLFLIIVYGGLLKGARILDLFNELGKLLLAITRGGICYSAVLASSLIGMVTGQAVANIALSGSMTIPAMKQRGVTPEQAGAIEVLASLGSQLLPPIMGLGAFLMAVILNVPYVEIALAAIIPAGLYVVTVIIAISFVVQSSPAISSEREEVDLRKILWLLPSFLIPFITLITLLYLRFSPSYAAFWAIAFLLGTSLLRPADYRPRLRELSDGLVYGVVAAAQLGLILAGIGLIVQVLITTGAGFDMGRIAMHAAGDSVGLALLFGMIIALLVGMGLPTPAAYALLAIIMIPFLIEIGVDAMPAHFFGFYFAIFSAVSPPVAVGIMTASRISGGSFYGTALQAIKMSLVCFLIPFAIVAFPSLLNFPDITFNAIVVSACLVMITFMWGGAVYGILGSPLKRWERLIMLTGPAGFVFMVSTSNIWYASVPAGVLAVMLLLIARRKKESPLLGAADSRNLS